MRLVPLQSSAVAGLAYNDDTEELVAQFPNGAVYVYQGVPAGVVVSILFDPDSQGTAFSNKVKKGSYPYRKVNDPESLGLHV